MMTLSKALTAGQAKKYYEAEYSNARESYYSEQKTIEGEWFGKLASEWGLEGAVDKEAFGRLTDGQHPYSCEQLIRHVSVKEYENQYGEKTKNSEHRAGYDATFSAPKSASLAALVGDDERIREAHRKAVKRALGDLEDYVQARMGGKTPAKTTRNFAAALFEHDSSRPDSETGYAAPQLHTHAVIFNLTKLDTAQIKPLQPIELYRSQKYATAIYRSVLSDELQKLGYEIEVDRRTGAPEIRGFSEDYLEASSPRRKQIKREAEEIKGRLADQGVLAKDGAGLNQAAAKLDRKSKRYDRTQMRTRHQEMDARFDKQATRAVNVARERGPVLMNEDESKKRAQAAVTFARQNAGAREAVVDKRKVVIDALRRSLSLTAHDTVIQELNERIESGEFIRVQRFDRFEELTTSQMVALERSNIHRMLAGRNTQEPMMRRKEASRVIKEIFERKGKRSSFDQYKAVGTILVSRDRVVALEGLAGTGKTTALAILREAAERQGFAVRGLAPTGRAADKLAESGIKTTTLQGFLKEPQFKSEANEATHRRLYVLDESSLSDTRNIHLFLQQAGQQSRILLVGDPAQHQAVEAGAPFEQLLKAGIRSVRLDKILRQRTNLKKPVELLSQKEVFAAVTLLESQGRITEINDDIDRLKAIALDYAGNPKGTLIISPANSERVAINTLIHRELQDRRLVDRNNHRLKILVNRQDMTGPERTFALAYTPGEDIIRYNTTSNIYGVKPGDYGRVLSNNHSENTVTVRLESGREIIYNPQRLSGVSVYREAERDFAVGDRIQFRAAFAEAKVKNSELGTIKQITDDKMIVRLDKKRDVSIPVERFRHLDHGYAVTSHSSQGQTVNRVLVNAETTETHALVNQRMAYVAISRARFEARIYTDSLKELGPAFNREKNKEIALDALHQSTDQAIGMDRLVIPDKDETLQPSTTQQLTNMRSIEATRPETNEAESAQQVIPYTERIRTLNSGLILGQKLAAALTEKYAAERLKEIVDGRDVRRYFVVDQTTGLRRKMSIHDVEQRAARVAARIADEQSSQTHTDRSADVPSWKEIRDSEYARQILKHDSTLKEILNAHTAELQKCITSLRGANQAVDRIAHGAQLIEAPAKATGAQLPLAILPHDKINELQANAIRQRDADGFEQLERIRHNTPHELGGPERDAFSFARLKGQAILAESNVAAAEKRLAEFEKSRHFAKFEIDGERWSLVRVDRQQRNAEREIEFNRRQVSAYRWRLYGGLQNPWKLRDILEYRERAGAAKEPIATAREEIRNLQPIRAEVQRLIDERRTELKNNVLKESQLERVLNRSIEVETATPVKRGQPLPKPEFNLHELKTLEENAITLRNPKMLRLAEREMNLHLGQTLQGREQLAARALGRAEAASISLKEVNERVQDFNKTRQIIPVIFNQADGEEFTASLNDLQPRTVTDKVFSFFSAKDRFEINAINQALDEQYSNFLTERKSLEQFDTVARNIANDLDQALRSTDEKLAIHANQQSQPQFTAKEIVQIENYAAKQIDPAIRAQFEDLVHSSLTAGHVPDFTELSVNAVRLSNPTQLQTFDSSQLHEDDYLEIARSTLVNLATEPTEAYGTLAAAATETEAGSEAWVALL